MADRPQAMCPGCNELVPIVHEVYWPHYATKIEQVPPLQVIVDLWPCEGSGLPMRECRVCGCTELDCSRCIVKTGQPCSWVEDDLCSACATSEQLVESAKERQRSLASAGESIGDWKPLEFERQVLGRFVDEEDSDAGSKRR